MALWGQGDPRWIVEERPDSTNVNNWHWTERDATTWSKIKLKELFQSLQEDTAEASWEIEEVKTMAGEATINNRKGKLIYFYEWDITLNYKGRVAGSELEHKGTINMPNLSDENCASDVDVQVSAKGDAKNAEKLKTIIRKNGIAMCQKMCQQYVEDLKSEYSKGMVLETKDQKIGDEAEITKCVNKKNNANTKFSNDIKSLSIKDTINCDKGNTKEIKLKEEFSNIPAEELFNILTHDARLSAFTRSQCFSDPKPGGQFSLMSGNILGSYVELVPGEKIIQKWKFKEWPADMFSTVIMKLEQKSSSTILSLTHSGIPEVDKMRAETGWKMHFWQPIRQIFGFGNPF